MSERVEAMRKFVEEYPDNPFPRYALAMEYRRAGQPAEAEDTLRGLVARVPDYVAGWQQLGQLLEDEGRADEAREAYGKGIEAARRAGNAHAASEMEAGIERL